MGAYSYMEFNIPNNVALGAAVCDSHCILSPYDGPMQGDRNFAYRPIWVVDFRLLAP